jgi:hypothetical protein
MPFFSPINLIFKICMKRIFQKLISNSIKNIRFKNSNSINNTTFKLNKNSKFFYSKNNKNKDGKKQESTKDFDNLIKLGIFKELNLVKK